MSLGFCRGWEVEGKKSSVRASQLSLCSSVAQLVKALHRNRRAASSTPARGPIVAFFATVSG